MPGVIPWKVVVTVPSLVAVAVSFGWFFVLTQDNAALAVAATAVGALGGYLGRVNGTKSNAHP